MPVIEIQSSSSEEIFVDIQDGITRGPEARSEEVASSQATQPRSRDNLELLKTAVYTEVATITAAGELLQRKLLNQLETATTGTGIHNNPGRWRGPLLVFVSWR